MQVVPATSNAVGVQTNRPAGSFRITLKIYKLLIERDYLNGDCNTNIFDAKDFGKSPNTSKKSKKKS